MLQERCRGQNDIGISRGISEELLMHDRKQVLAHKTAHHIIMVRRDNRRIEL